MPKNKKIEKEIKFFLCIGVIFIAFLMYYLPKYYATINLQKKFFQNYELHDKSFDDMRNEMNKRWQK